MRFVIHCGDRLPGKSLKDPLNQALSPGLDPEQYKVSHFASSLRAQLDQLLPPQCLLLGRNVSSTDEV